MYPPVDETRNKDSGGELSAKAHGAWAFLRAPGRVSGTYGIRACHSAR